MNVVNVVEKLKKINGYWQPGRIGRVNDMDIKVGKLLGEFEWHHHTTEDELFYVVEGELDMHFRDGVKVVREGEFIIVPHGVEHMPVAREEVHIMLFEPATTVNTGTNEGSDRRHDPRDL